MSRQLEMFDLTGKVAVVTGGNGGIGFGMARGLARAGANIAVVWRNEETSAQAVAASVSSSPSASPEGTPDSWLHPTAPELVTTVLPPTVVAAGRAKLDAPSTCATTSAPDRLVSASSPHDHAPAVES